MSAGSRGAALITGASSGIGRAIAGRFAADGWSLIVHGRDAGRLRRAAEELEREHRVPVRILIRDLADPAAPRAIHDEVRDAGLEVEALVNSAGFGGHGPFVRTDLGAELEMIQVNIAALTELTKLFLPPMVERRRGWILNLASTAGFQPGPLMAVYYATKAYVLHFSEALADELRGTGVTVTTLCPGPTRTGFQARAGAEETRLLSGSLVPVLSPEEVAAAGYEGLMRGKGRVVPGRVNRLLIQAQRVSPRWLALRLVRALNERRHRRGAAGSG